MEQADAPVDKRRWAAVLDRSGTGFVYAVTSTGVYCRPTCPSRRPRRDRVRFFDAPGDAERAGFRACRRCRPSDEAAPGAMNEAVNRACAYLAAHAGERVTLRTLGRLAGVTPTHFQRVFKRAVGLSPREYHAACRADRFREELRAGRDVTTALYEAGYGSPSRIYETPPTGRGMAPAAYRRGGAGTTIAFTAVRTPLGWLLVASTEKGVCAVRLGDSKSALEAELRAEFPAAAISATDAVPEAWIAEIVERLSGSSGGTDVPLDVRGTSFQWRVWRALQRIPPGQTRSYAAVARAIGRPTAVRAVARACAANPVGVVIPCHRVIAHDGGLGGYRWGVSRKAKLLKTERRTSGAAPKPK
jgi:AraC family transcriptional regulator of adaptative response/methylated-DNA-[protein]-cysteine methyltransferase